MNSYQKSAAGVLMVFIGAIWLFFVIIWMPPLAFALILMGMKFGLPDDFYGGWMLWFEVITASSVIGYGIYLLTRRRHVISN